MCGSVNTKNGNKDDDNYAVFSLDDAEIDNLGKVIGTKYS